MTADATPDPGARFHRALALLVAGAFFMEILDGAVIAPAAPAIAGDLGVQPVDINVAITAYLLTVAVLIPISGWLADRFGARTVFTAAIAVFTVASAGCAAASTLPMLTGTRVLQGIGGALMVPVGRLVVLRGTAKRDLIHAIAYLTWPALIAPVIAPAVGGVLSEYASWRWIFLLNLPLGLAGLLLARRLVPDTRGEGPRPLDWRGFLLTAAGVAALLIGMESASLGTSDGWVVVVGLGGSAIVLTAAIVSLLRARAPLLDLRILRIDSFRVAAFGGSVYRLVITAVPFLLALFFQAGFGWNSAQAGVVLIALFAGNVAIKPATTPLMRRFGIRAVMLTAVLSSAVVLVALAFLRADTPLALIVTVLVVSGVFRSVGFSAYNSVAFADVDASRMAPANTLLSTLQELGSGLGVAVGALLLRLGEPVAESVGLLDEPASPFRVALVLLAVLMVVPAIEAFALSRTAGSHVTGRV